MSTEKELRKAGFWRANTRSGGVRRVLVVTHEHVLALHWGKTWSWFGFTASRRRMGQKEGWIYQCSLVTWEFYLLLLIMLCHGQDSKTRQNSDDCTPRSRYNYIHMYKMALRKGYSCFSLASLSSRDRRRCRRNIVYTLVR